MVNTADEFEAAYAELKKDFDQGDYIKRIYCLDLEEL